MTPEAALLVGFVLLKEVRKTLLQEKLPQVLESGREKKKKDQRSVQDERLKVIWFSEKWWWMQVKM